MFFDIDSRPISEGLFNIGGGSLYYISDTKTQQFTDNMVFANSKRKALYWYLEHSSPVKYKEIKESEYSSWFEKTNELIINSNYNKYLDKTVYVFNVSGSAFGKDREYGSRIENMDKFKVNSIDELSLRDLIKSVKLKLSIKDISPAEISNRRRIVMELRKQFSISINNPKFKKFKDTRSIYLNLNSKDINDFINCDSDSLTYIGYDLNKFYKNKARFYFNEDGSKEYNNLFRAFVKDLHTNKYLNHISFHGDGDWDDGTYSARIRKNPVNTNNMLVESVFETSEDNVDSMNTEPLNEASLLYKATEFTICSIGTWPQFVSIHMLIRGAIKQSKTNAEAIKKLEELRPKIKKANAWRTKNGNIIPVLDKAFKRSVFDSAERTLDRKIDELKSGKYVIKEDMVDSYDESEIIVAEDYINTNSLLESSLTSYNGLYPIYVVLFSNDTDFGKMIRKLTGSPYSHATITLDPSLNDMYSFSDIPYNYDKMNVAGFVRESIYSPMYRKNRYFTILTTFTDKAGIKNYKEKLDKFKKDYIDYKYNDIGLVQYYLNFKNTKDTKMERRKMRWFCSEFVTLMLSKAGIEGFEDVLQAPGDLRSKKELIEIGDYTLNNFSEKDLRNKTRSAYTKYIAQHENGDYLDESYDDVCLDFEAYQLSESDINLLMEAKLKDGVSKESDVTKYTALLDWGYLYKQFRTIFPETDPSVRFDLFEIIIRDYIVPLRLSVEKTMNTIIDECLRIKQSIVGNIGKILGASVEEQTITVKKKNRQIIIKYPDLIIKK